MEVYVEVIFLTNFLIILSSLEMMGILLCKEMSYLQVLKESFLLSFSVLLLYIDSYSWMILIMWLIIFYVLYHKQIFLYYPVFLFIYFSILYFVSSFINDAFIYNGVLIVPISFSSFILFIVGLLFVLFQVMFVVYLKRTVRINSYLYPVELFYDGKKYGFKGFLDSGNEVYYEGFPLILVNEKVIDNYEVIDVVELDDLRSGFISIIKVDMLTVNNQLLENIYVGIINGIRYDCLLNKSLMGGIL